MTTEFQVLYELGNGHYEPGKGPVHVLNAVAEAADQLRRQFSEAGYHVVGVNKVRPVIDWTQPNFDRDEAAAFLRIESGTLSVHKGSGRVPWSAAGAGIYPRHWLESYVLDNANEAGKETAARLENEAA